MKFDYSSIGFYTFDCLCWPFEAVPDGGGTCFVDDFTLAVSGAAGTAVIVAARMGLGCLAVGGLGCDLMGEWVERRLLGFGVDVSALPRIAGARTSSSIVTTRPNGMRPALHMRGATGDFFVDDALLPMVVDAHVVHFGGIGLMDRMDHGRNAELARAAQARGAVTTVDVFAASAADLPSVASILPHTDYFMPSIEEALALTGIKDCGDLARFFIDRGVACCIFTLGEDGAYYHHRDGTRFAMPAFDIAMRCSCGCGDAFDGAFAVALRRGMDPETSVRFAQAASALNATGLGSQAGIESFEHTLDFMRTTKLRKSNTASVAFGSEPASA